MTLIRFTTLTLFCCFLVPPGHAQHTACNRMAWPIDIDNIAGKPFTAERVTTTKDDLVVCREFLARDSAARLRDEMHPLNSETDAQEATLQKPEGDTIKTTSGELRVWTRIFLLVSGDVIELKPAMQVAMVMNLGGNGPRVAPATKQYQRSDLDIGVSEIDGLPVHGWRNTTFYNRDDGSDCSVEHEMWVSEDLDVAVLCTWVNSCDDSETRTVLKNIKRVEPDAQLFKVPAGYKVNPTPIEMPRTTTADARSW